MRDCCLFVFQLTVEHYLTVANVYNYYHHVTEAAQYIAKAQRALKLNFEMVGECPRISGCRCSLVLWDFVGKTCRRTVLV